MWLRKTSDAGPSLTRAYVPVHTHMYLGLSTFEFSAFLIFYLFGILFLFFILPILYFVYPCKPSAILSRLQWHIHGYIYAYIKYMLIFEKDRSNPNPDLKVSGAPESKGRRGRGSWDFHDAIACHLPVLSPLLKVTQVSLVQPLG